MDFRYYHDSHDDPLQGTLFFSDLWGVMNSKRKNPNTCVIISLEEDGSSQCDYFWRNPMITQLLNTRARVVRLRREADEENFNQFLEIVNANDFPAIFVYGPNSNGPTFSFTGIPNVSQFCEQFSSLNIPYMSISETIDQPQPVFSNTEGSHDAVINDYIEHMQTAQPPKQKKAKKHEARKVEVTIILPDNTSITHEFLLTETVLAVQSFTRGRVDQTATFELHIEPSGEKLPDDPLLPLSQFAPSVTLRVTVIKSQPKNPFFGTKNQNKNHFQNNGPNQGFQWIPASVRRFFSYISPFASVEDDPADFWLTTSPQPKHGRVVRPMDHGFINHEAPTNPNRDQNQNNFNVFGGQAHHL